ncbi:MAG TPA: hypothetical protein HPP66_09240 [Planctomycetes bacterium]|nr:hypothetical protein [Planctomycetota bacterium]
MKKIVLALVVLVFAAPAWADVVITCAQVGDTNEVVISFDAMTETNLVRAFGLDIQFDDDATVLSVGNLNPDYYIYPGTISIDTTQTPPEIDYGTPVAEYGDLPSDTLPGLGSNGVTLEMASLYVGDGNAPAKSGALLSLYVSRPTAPDLQTCLTITGNVARAGSSGVVMEDPDELVTVNATGCCVDFPSDEPICWGFVGQPCGDSDGSGSVNIADLVALKASWFKSDPDPAYNPCADFDRSGGVNIADLVRLKAYWFKTVPPCP